MVGFGRGVCKDSHISTEKRHFGDGTLSEEERERSFSERDDEAEETCLLCPIAQ